MPATEIYTLSLHDALPIFIEGFKMRGEIVSQLKIRFPLKRCFDRLVIILHKTHEKSRIQDRVGRPFKRMEVGGCLDRKSTRLNSSHQIISYAVFCLKKKR